MFHHTDNTSFLEIINLVLLIYLIVIKIQIVQAIADTLQILVFHQKKEKRKKKKGNLVGGFPKTKTTDIIVNSI